MEQQKADFGFGFNDVKFSNTTLRIVIQPDHHDHKPSYSISRPAMTNSSRSPGCRKRCLHQSHPEQILLQRKKKTRDSAGYPGLEDVSHVVSGIEIPTNQPPAATETSKLLHVNSLILAGNSLFFRKMFTNGMKESQQQHTATIHIQASEEDAFMDLLKFMYSGTLSSTTPSALWDVLLAADKFDVPSCIKLCTELLMNLPMTLELALLYVQLCDSTGSMPDFIRPLLKDSVGDFLVEHFKNMASAEVEEELLQLPLVGVVEVVLSSDYLRIKSEDQIYDFIVKWVQKHYSNQLEERQKMLNLLVERYLRFPFISSAKMKDILTCRDMDPEIASELAVGALRYHQAQPPPHQQTDVPVDKFVKRAYHYHPLKVVDNSSSHPQCILYLEIRRDEFEIIFPWPRHAMVFQPFALGKHMLTVCATVQEADQDRNFLLFFSTSTWMEEHDPQASEASGLSVHCEIASTVKPSEKFETLIDENMILPEGGDFIGYGLCDNIPWEEFIGENSRYFVNDILRLRCHLTVAN